MASARSASGQLSVTATSSCIACGTGGVLPLKALSVGNLDAILKKAGERLPPEARQALEAAGQAIKAQGQEPTGQAKGSGDIGAKLDKALERLEKDVKELKAKTAK